MSQSSPPVPPPPPTPFEQRPDPLSYVPPSIHVATRAERVGFLPRLGAALLDAIILVPVLFIAIPGVVYLEEQGRLTPALSWAFEVGLALTGLAYTSFEIFMAATPGKMILKLRIAADDGTDADGWRLFNRWFYKNGGSVLGLLAVIIQIPLLEKIGNLWGLIIAIGCFFVLGEARQAFHDRRAGTAVYRKAALRDAGFQPLMSPSVVGQVAERAAEGRA